MNSAVYSVNLHQAVMWHWLPFFICILDVENEFLEAGYNLDLRKSFLIFVYFPTYINFIKISEVIHEIHGLFIDVYL